MKIAYISVHEVLHHDEATLLTELGHEVFVPGGAYVSPENRGDQGNRPPLQKSVNFDRWKEMFDRCGVAGKDNKENLSIEFIKEFDLIIFMHDIFIAANWDRLKKSGIPVILRTIGQSWKNSEEKLVKYRKEGLRIVRYSPREEKIPGYAGGEILIRFYKDPLEFCGWTGEKKEVISFAQSMERRGGACNFKWFEEVTRPFPRKLYGAESESLPYGKGRVPYEELKAAMRDHRVYVYTGTFPASVTLSGIEAMMTSVPILAIGPALGHPFPWFADHPLYEMGDIIQNGVNGFCSDSMQESQDFIRQCLDDHEFARRIGAAGRETAIKLFGKETIKAQWKDFLEKVAK